MRPKNLVEYIAGGNLPVKKGRWKDGNGQDVLVPQKPEPNPTKASVQDPDSGSGHLSLSRDKDSGNATIREHYSTCQCKGVHFEKSLKSAMKKDSQISRYRDKESHSDNICACNCILCKARHSESAKRKDDKKAEQSNGRTKRECWGWSISKQDKNKGRNANTHQRQENHGKPSSEVQKPIKATSFEYRTYSSNFCARIIESDELAQHYSSQRSPVAVMSRLLMPSRSEVVIREDVIECQSDPRPNAFFDSRIGVMRVYHGPNFGNSSATLAPLCSQRAPSGPEIGDTFGGLADHTINGGLDSRWTAISGPRPGGRQRCAQSGPSGWSGEPWASGGRNDNPSNSQQGSNRNDMRSQNHNLNNSNKNQRRSGNDNRGWNKSGPNSSESHNNGGNTTWNRNNSTTWDNNNESSNDRANDDGVNDGRNWENTHTSDNYNNNFGNDGNTKNDSNSDHSYEEDNAGDSNNLPGAWPSDENDKNDNYDNNAGNGGEFNDDNWGGDNSKFNNDDTDNFGDWNNSNDNNQNSNDNYRSSSKNQSNWNRNNQNDQSHSNRKQYNNYSGNDSFGNKAFDNGQSGSPSNQKKRMNQDQSYNWNQKSNHADPPWDANPAQTVLSDNSWDDSNAIGPTAPNGGAYGGGRGRASNRNNNQNKSGNTSTGTNRAPQGNNRNDNFSGNENARNKGRNRGSGNFNGNDNSREDANNEWGPPAVQAPWADPAVAADTSGWGSSAWK